MDASKAYVVNQRCQKPNLSPEDLVKKYSEWAPNYDDTLHPGLYRGPSIVANEVATRIPEDQRKTVRILDIAAGTGQVGILLKAKGFTNIDALEPAEGMMQLLKETGVYSTTYQEFIGNGQNSVPDETYDVLVIAGGMGEGHIPFRGLDDMIRITKSGGLVINVMRKEYLQDVAEYKDRLVPYMDLLEKNGYWSKVEVKTIPRYAFDKEGILFTYKVL